MNRDQEQTYLVWRVITHQKTKTGFEIIEKQPEYIKTPEDPFGVKKKNQMSVRITEREAEIMNNGVGDVLPNQGAVNSKTFYELEKAKPGRKPKELKED